MKQFMADAETISEPLLVFPGCLTTHEDCVSFIDDLTTTPSAAGDLTTTEERRTEYRRVAQYLKKKFPHEERGIAYIEHIAVSDLSSKANWFIALSLMFLFHTARC